MFNVCHKTRRWVGLGRTFPEASGLETVDNVGGSAACQCRAVAPILSYGNPVYYGPASALANHLAHLGRSRTVAF